MKEIGSRVEEGGWMVGSGLTLTFPLDLSNLMLDIGLLNGCFWTYTCPWALS